jgi:hypothetical protein
MYKIYNEQSAPSLREKFIKIKDLNREYILRSNDTDLALPKPKTNYLKRSLKYSGAMLWKSLPSEAKNASSLYQFKRSMPTIPETNATSFPGSLLLGSKDPGRSWSRDP